MTKPNIKAKIAALLLALLVCFGAVMGGQGNLSAFAAEDNTVQFEQPILRLSHLRQRDSHHRGSGG